MAMLTMVKAIKQIHPKDVVLFKVGSFYQTYSKDLNTGHNFPNPVYKRIVEAKNPPSRLDFCLKNLGTVRYYVKRACQKEVACYLGVM